MRASAVEAGRRYRRVLDPRRFIALIAVPAVLFVAAAPALGADVRVDLPQVSIDVQDMTFTVSGTAPVGEQVATLVVVVVVVRLERPATRPHPPSRYRAPACWTGRPSTARWARFSLAVGDRSRARSHSGTTW